MGTYKNVKALVLKAVGRGPGITDNACVNILPVPGHPHRGIAMTETIPGAAFLHCRLCRCEPTEPPTAGKSSTRGVCMAVTIRTTLEPAVTAICRQGAWSVHSQV